MDHHRMLLRWDEERSMKKIGTTQYRPGHFSPALRGREFYRRQIFDVDATTLECQFFDWNRVFPMVSQKFSTCPKSNHPIPFDGHALRTTTCCFVERLVGSRKLTILLNSLYVSSLFSYGKISFDRSFLTTRIGPAEIRRKRKAYEKQKCSVNNVRVWRYNSPNNRLSFACIRSLFFTDEIVEELLLPKRIAIAGSVTVG